MESLRGILRKEAIHKVRRINAVNIVQIVMHRNDHSGVCFLGENDRFLASHISNDVLYIAFVIAAAIDWDHKNIYVHQAFCQTFINTAVTAMVNGEVTNLNFVPHIEVVPVFIHT